MSDIPSPEENLFATAAALPATERGAFLDRACADGAVRGRIESLLRAHDKACDFLERPPQELAHRPASCEVVVEEKPGDRIGRYKLLQKIGEGGCGVVYMAEQEEAVRRRVALKVIKLGMDTKAVIARFEAERQALARMEHPNIARVLDAGATSSGRPFFVMELVRGLRITDYCDRNQLPTEQRLRLFVKVCQAIQHAHQKGIIHRDIKPSNILVTLHDGEPVPKVIDFGIAKATQGRLTDQTLFTAFEQFIGTPAYVSPEQAEMSGLDLDTRSDIYSLGVLLYALVAGRTPFDTTELTQSGIAEMRRRIREQEPPRPSVRLRTLNDEDRTAVAQRRGTDAPQLTLRLRGDIDWIVMRCLEKDRSRRYETANGLALDIERHLENEPVTARPPSTTYLLQKLIRRHRFAFGATAGMIAALGAGFTASTLLYMRERASNDRVREAEARARSEQVRAESARLEAEAGRKRVQEEAARRAKLATLMTGTLKDIGLHVSPVGTDRRVLLDMVVQTTDLKKEFADQPAIVADVDELLAGISFKLGDFVRAEELLLNAVRLRQSIDKEGPDIARALNYLGFVYSGQSRWAEAEICHRDALELQQKRFGQEHAEVARTLSTRGWVLGQQAKLTEAEHFLRIAVDQQRKLRERADLAGSLARLGSVLTQAGRINVAEDALREAVHINREVFGRDSLETARALNLLAVTVALDQTRLPTAIQLYRDAFNIREQINGSAPRDSLGARSGTDARGADHSADREARVSPPTLEAMLSDRGIMGDVDAALHDAQRYALQQYGRDSWEGAFYHALRAWVMLQEHKYVQAEHVVRQCLAIREHMRPNDWSTHHARHLLGAALAGQGRRDEAEPLLVEGYRGTRAAAATIPAFHKPRLGESVKRLIDFYAKLGRSEEVARWQAEFNGLDDDAKQVLLPTALK